MRGRAVVSLLMAWAFLVSGFTGLVLYIEPYGRIAFWNNWQLLSLNKNQWDGIHIISSWLFIIAGSFHLYLNWKPFLGYIGVRIKKGKRLRVELAISTAAIFVVILSGIFHIPPLGYILDLNHFAKSSWSSTDSTEPPFGHAELETLDSLAHKFQIDMEKILFDLKRQNISVTSVHSTLDEIAKDNGLTPAQLYMMIDKKEVRLYHKHLPLDRKCYPLLKRDFHRFACHFARAAECAGEQDKFWEMNDAHVFYRLQQVPWQNTEVRDNSFFTRRQ